LYTCEDEIALIYEPTTKDSNSTIPRYFVQPQTPFKPTDINPGETGLTFPSSDKAYIIIFPISPAAMIKSIRLPKTTNVDQIRVMFLDDQDKPIPAQPSDTVPLQITSKVENNPKVNVNFPTKVNAVHITLIHTSDGKPPKGVTVEIIICIEPTTVTTPTPSSTPTSRKNFSIISSSCFLLFFFLIAPSGVCQPKRNPAARITQGECISQKEIELDSCAGYCPSFEELDPLSGNVTQKECLCCAPDSSYNESITMDCRNPLTGLIEQRTSSIIRIQSCKCSMCLGSSKYSASANKLSYATYDDVNQSKAKTKTRRR
jgi:hypothetical protein